MSQPPDHLNSSPPVDIFDNEIKQDNYVLNEIQRILYWAHHEPIHKRKQEGFVVSHQQTVLQDDTINLHLKNPSDSELSANFSNIKGATHFAGNIRIYDTFSTVPSGGTTKTIDNLLMDSGGSNGTTSGGMEANANVDFAANGTPHFESTIPGGGGGGGRVGGILEGTQPIIEPGRELVVEIENISNSDESGSLGFVFTETDTIYSEEL